MERPETPFEVLDSLNSEKTLENELSFTKIKVSGSELRKLTENFKVISEEERIKNIENTLCKLMHEEIINIINNILPSIAKNGKNTFSYCFSSNIYRIIQEKRNDCNYDNRLNMSSIIATYLKNYGSTINGINLTTEFQYIKFVW